MMNDDPTDPEFMPTCLVCGCDLEWQQCYECGGEGGWLAYERDYDPLWDNPDDWVACDLCEGEGGWLECPNEERHPRFTVLAEED